MEPYGLAADRHELPGAIEAAAALDGSAIYTGFGIGSFRPRGIRSQRLESESSRMATSKVQTDRYLWNAAAMVGLSAVLCAVSFALIYLLAMPMSRVRVFDLSVLGLGAFRLIHLITFDKIWTSPAPPDGQRCWAAQKLLNVDGDARFVN